MAHVSPENGVFAPLDYTNPAIVKCRLIRMISSISGNRQEPP